MSISRALRVIHVQVKTLWMILGITLLLLLLVEGIASVIDHARGGDTTREDRRASADGYAGVDWVKDYFREFNVLGTADSAHVAWTPYVYWRRTRFSGKYINIDDHGIRRTWSAQDSQRHGKRTVTIWIFGGSTLWGTGARDEGTIPSFLARLIAADSTVDVSVQVVNLGETGYVSTQEVILLLRTLQTGAPPDLVVFYDGGNDVLSAWQQRVAGLPENEENRRTEFNLLKDFRRPALYRAAFTSWIRGSSIFHLLRGRSADAEGVEGGPPITSEALDNLASDTATTYAANVGFVDALASRYKFKTLFYWEPTIFAKTALSPSEGVVMTHCAEWRTVFARVHDRLLSSPDIARRKSFQDISNLYAEEKKSYFLDCGHVTEAGNELTAKRIFGDVKEILQGLRL